MALSAASGVHAQLLGSTCPSLSARRVTVRCQAEPVRRPASPTEAAKPVVVATPPSPTSSPAVESLKDIPSGVTLEYQRQSAKEMVAYFQEKKLEEELKEGQVLGFTRKNEIGNGR